MAENNSPNTKPETEDPEKRRARIARGKTVALFIFAGVLLALAFIFKPKPREIIPTCSDFPQSGASCRYGMVCVNGAWECQPTPDAACYGGKRACVNNDCFDCQPWPKEPSTACAGGASWRPADEVCNGIDDDCDNFVDNGGVCRQGFQPRLPDHCDQLDDNCYGDHIVWPARPIPVMMLVDEQPQVASKLAEPGKKMDCHEIVAATRNLYNLRLMDCGRSSLEFLKRVHSFPHLKDAFKKARAQNIAIFPRWEMISYSAYNEVIINQRASDADIAQFILRAIEENERRLIEAAEVDTSGCDDNGCTP